MLVLDINFFWIHTRHWRNVRLLSSITPRYLGYFSCFILFPSIIQLKETRNSFSIILFHHSICVNASRNSSRVSDAEKCVNRWLFRKFELNSSFTFRLCAVEITPFEFMTSCAAISSGETWNTLLTLGKFHASLLDFRKSTELILVSHSFFRFSFNFRSSCFPMLISPVLWNSSKRSLLSSDQPGINVSLRPLVSVLTLSVRHRTDRS